MEDLRLLFYSRCFTFTRKYTRHDRRFRKIYSATKRLHRTGKQRCRDHNRQSQYVDLQFSKGNFLIENILDVLYDFLVFLSGSVAQNMGCLNCSFYIVEHSKLQCDSYFSCFNLCKVKLSDNFRIEKIKVPQNTLFSVGKISDEKQVSPIYNNAHVAL